MTKQAASLSIPFDNTYAALSEAFYARLSPTPVSNPALVAFNKDLADLLQMAHKMRMDEIKAQAELEKAQATNVKSQTNVQINEGLPFGQGNYGKLMDKLLKDV